MPPTANHVCCPNVPATHYFRNVWTLTRALKKAGWKYKGSSDGFGVDVSGDPALDKWGEWSTSQQETSSGTGAVIDAPALGRATITGLSGIVAADKGRFIRFAGSATPANNNYHQIEEILSATSVRIDARNFAVAADAGPLTWDIHDPTYDLDTHWANSYLSIVSAQCWWAAEGPTIIKIPITGPSAAGPYNQLFLRGENVRQAVTGFQGEITGYIWWTDGVTTIGYLVVNPRVRGTGAGVYGLSGGVDAITGDVSGASVAGANVDWGIAYTEEIVFYKSANQWNGKVFSGFFDKVAEETVRFCGFDQLAGATATIAPGSSSGPIGFPPHGAVVHGVDSSSAAASTWGCNPNGVVSANRGLGLAVAADCIEEEGWSQDGSWVWACGIGGQFYDCVGAAFQRLDNTEAGDVHPFVYINNKYGDMYNDNRATGCHTPTDTDYSGGFGEFGGTDVAPTISIKPSNFGYSAQGWLGYSTTQEKWGAYTYGLVNTMDAFYTTGWAMMNQNAGQGHDHTDPEASYTQPPYGLVRTREPFWILRNATTTRHRKGTTRWMFAVQGGMRFDMSDDKRFIQLGRGVQRASSNLQYCAISIGPWDGVTQQRVS